MQWKLQACLMDIFWNVFILMYAWCKNVKQQLSVTNSHVLISDQQMAMLFLNDPHRVCLWLMF